MKGYRVIATNKDSGSEIGYVVACEVGRRTPAALSVEVRLDTLCSVNPAILFTTSA